VKIAVHGLWHLGSVTAACLAEAGHEVVGVDREEVVLEGLRAGRAPLQEPGLDDLLASGLASGRLRFAHSDDARAALRDIEILWVAFDTPVDEQDQADVGFVRAELERVVDALPRAALVLNSSQVPVGFTRALERDWKGRGLRFAVSPENLRLGKALDAFKRAERAIVGVRDEQDRACLETLFAPFVQRIEWMSVESAEMSKHALNAFLATSVTFINELARLCERLGADAKEVERALKSEPRIGPRAYLGPGAAFAGGTLARDLRYLQGFGQTLGVDTPLVDGVLTSNARHASWLHEKIEGCLTGVAQPVVAVLGLTYRPGTSTLRRSSSVELVQMLHARGIHVRAHDPAVKSLPPELEPIMALCANAHDALRGADLAVVATEWPDYRALQAADIVQGMRRAWVVDQNFFLAQSLAAAPGLTYLAPGRAPRDKEQL
jgi:UDPglucose 6-dehydrogenase